jgi:hypothetical protein
MNSERNKARIEQVKTNRESRGNTPCKESITMVNPTYIAAKQEVATSTLNLRQRKRMTPAERKTLIYRQHEGFSAKQRKTISKSLVYDINWKNLEHFLAYFSF